MYIQHVPLPAMPTIPNTSNESDISICMCLLSTVDNYAGVYFVDSIL
jgi:hypothetical protein